MSTELENFKTFFEDKRKNGEQGYRLSSYFLPAVCQCPGKDSYIMR